MLDKIYKFTNFKGGHKIWKKWIIVVLGSEH